MPKPTPIVAPFHKSEIAGFVHRYVRNRLTRTSHRALELVKVWEARCLEVYSTNLRDVRAELQSVADFVNGEQLQKVNRFKRSHHVCKELRLSLNALKTAE